MTDLRKAQYKPHHFLRKNWKTWVQSRGKQFIRSVNTMIKATQISDNQTLFLISRQNRPLHLEFKYTIVKFCVGVAQSSWSYYDIFLHWMFLLHLHLYPRHLGTKNLSTQSQKMPSMTIKCPVNDKNPWNLAIKIKIICIAISIEHPWNSSFLWKFSK